MKCPACSNPLEKVTVEGITIDVCRTGCGGIWFDHLELKKVDEKHETAGQNIVDLKINPTVTVDCSQRRNCPRCKTPVMRRHFMSEKREVAVDECPACGGIWLDWGELGQIRNQFDTEAERKQAFEEQFNATFGKALEAMKEEDQEDLQRTHKVAGALRFICPSFYIPGKQSGGAF